MKRIKTDKAPGAIGPYAQAVEANGFIFTSGQIPLDPVTGEVVPGSIEEQAERTLLNLGAVLEAAGATFADVVKATVFLTDLADFAGLNTVYARFFQGEGLAARSCVQVAALPRGVRVEIEAIAVKRP